MKKKLLASILSLLAVGGLASCSNRPVGTDSSVSSVQDSSSASSSSLPSEESSSLPSSSTSTYPEDVFSITSFGDAYTGATIPLACRIDGGLLAPEDQLNTEYTITVGADLAQIVDSRYVNFFEEVGSITIQGTLEKDGKTYTADLNLEIKDFYQGAITVAEVKESEVGETITASGVVTAFVGSSSGGRSGFYLSDETETIYVFGYDTAESVERGDVVVISGTVSEYNNCLQIASPVLERSRPGTEYPDPSAYIDTSLTASEDTDVTTVDAVLAASNIAGHTFMLNGKVTTYSGTGDEGTYTNYRFEDAVSGTYINIYSAASSFHCPENEWLDPYVESGEDITVAFYINSQSSSGRWRGNIVYIYDDAQ